MWNLIWCLLTDCHDCSCANSKAFIPEEKTLAFIVVSSLAEVVNDILFSDCSCTINQRAIKSGASILVLFLEVMLVLKKMLEVEVSTRNLLWVDMLFQLISYLLELCVIILLVRKCEKLATVVPSKWTGPRVGDKYFIRLFLPFVGDLLLILVLYLLILIDF